MHKKTIICIVGESGTGKTFIAQYLEEKYLVPMIESRTTRPKRNPDEKGHTFVSDEEFDTYKKEDMLAYTDFGGNRYCCLVKDIVSDFSTYVIDEYGLKYLRNTFSDIFNIFAVRVLSLHEERERRVGKDRVSRDTGRFTMTEDNFDSFLYNDYIEQETYRKVDTIYSRIQKLYGTR